MSLRAQSLRDGPVERGHQILRTLAKNHEPDHVAVAVSGGDDSITALHFAARNPAIGIDEVVHVDTGIGVTQTTEFVREQCDQLGVPLTVLSNDNARFGHERFEHLCRQFGFPGANPVAHTNLWRNLKEKPISRYTKSIDGGVALVSGVRKHESENRMENLTGNAIQTIRGVEWASPLIEFTDDDLAAYRTRHGIDDNFVASLLCTSGECFCGSYADRENLPLIEQYFPAVAQQIYDIEWKVLDQVARGEVPEKYALWAHGSVDQGEYEARLDEDQEKLTCSDCDDRCPAGPYEQTGKPLSPAEAFLNDHSLANYWNHPFYCAACDRVVEDPYTHRLEVHPFDAEEGLEGQWDMRMIDVAASDQSSLILTEPNGWNLALGQVTRDVDEGENRKHKYYYEDIALSHCDGHGHGWTEYNDGPVRKCQDCFAFDLSEYDHQTTGPPAASSADGAGSQVTEGEAERINHQLADFR